MEIETSALEEQGETKTHEKAEKETESTNPRDTVNYWKKWIKSAKKAGERHASETRDAWREYEGSSISVTNSIVETTKEKESYPTYWASVKTLEPAYYSRTPRITSKRTFDVEDETARVASILVERLGNFLVENSNFDSAMQSAVLDFIHGDKATVQVNYSVEIIEDNNRINLYEVQSEQGDTVYTTADGAVYDGEVFKDEEGLFGQTSDEYPDNQKILLTACPFDEVLHTPDAKNESEIREKAYYFWMTKDEAVERFGEEKTRSISWKRVKNKEDNKSEREEDEGSGEQFLEGWECWSRTNKKVYWVSEQYHDGFLDEREDLYQLEDFFPSCKFIISSKPSKDLYPTSAFKHCEAVLEELKTASRKISKLIKAIRRRALVDGASDELIDALTRLNDAEFIPVQNLNHILEKGGIQNMVWYVPVQELVASITEFTQLQDKFKNEFYEWFGLPDILRGATDPLETAKAQEIKATSAHDRFKYNKKLVACLAREAVQKMVDLALATFTDDYLAEVVGYRFLSEDKQALYLPAMELLKNDKSRIVRVDIETDTMSFADEQMRAQQVGQAVQAIMSGLEKVAQMAQISPDFARVGLQALLYSLDTLSVGKEFSGQVKQSVNALLEKMSQSNDAPPPPDYAQMQLQLQQQDMQIRAQQKERELQIKEMETSLKAQKQEQDAQEMMHTHQLQQYQLQMDTQLNQYAMQLEAQRVQIEQFRAQLQAQESQMEEVRLAREADAKIVSEQNKMMMGTRAKEPQVQINIDNGKQEGVLPPIYPSAPIEPSGILDPSLEQAILAEKMRGGL